MSSDLQYWLKRLAQISEELEARIAYPQTSSTSIVGTGGAQESRAPTRESLLDVKALIICALRGAVALIARELGS